jgi:hypothetical protein
LRQADKQPILAEPSWANTQAEIEKLQSELARLLSHVMALANRTKSLTDIVTVRDAIRRLRAEVQVVFVHFSDDSAHARMAGERQGSLTKSPDVRPPITGRAGNFVSAPADGARPEGASPGTQAAAIIERRLSERPTDIRDAARALAKAIAAQIELLNGSRPNDDEPQTRHDDFVAFLRQIAAGLDELADSIDRAIAAGSAASPEPILLGRAGEIACKLEEVLTKGLERNSPYIMDCAIKFSVFAAGFTFLHACGIDDKVAAIVGGLMSKGSKSKK